MRTKNVTSIKLTIKIVGGSIAANSTIFPIGYKLMYSEKALSSASNFAFHACYLAASGT
jgi:hypothetical protein